AIDCSTPLFEPVDYWPATTSAASEHSLVVELAFNPETKPESVVKVAEGVDLVLCMSIHPGYSGQEFMPDALPRIAKTRELLPSEIHLQVDGGITNENVRSVYDAGATLIVAGSAIFEREDLPRAYR